MIVCGSIIMKNCLMNSRTVNKIDYFLQTVGCIIRMVQSVITSKHSEHQYIVH